MVWSLQANPYLEKEHDRGKSFTVSIHIGNALPVTPCLPRPSLLANPYLEKGQ